MVILKYIALYIKHKKQYLFSASSPIIGGVSHPNRKLKQCRARLIVRTMTANLMQPVTPSFSLRVKSPPPNVPRTVDTSFSGPVIKSIIMSRVMRKLDFSICENKDADQLRGNREADQCLCFRYTDSTIPLLSIYEISSLYPSCVVVQPGLCMTWSETTKTGFLTTRLIL